MPGKEICSFTGGVKAFPIAGRTADQRERLYYPMTDEERRWRAQFVKDQYLEHGESEDNFVLNEDYYLATRNIFRRIYHIPMNIVQKNLLEPRMTKYNALIARSMITKVFMLIGLVGGVHYYFKYQRHTWAHPSGWDVFMNRGKMWPDDPAWPNVPTPKKEEFYDRGFSNSALYPKGN